MKKRLTVIVMCVAMAVAMLGCNKAKEVDVTSLANELNTGIVYQDELTILGEDVVPMIFDFGDARLAEAIVMEGSGGTAEEIVVIKCEDADSAAAVENTLKERVAEQKESFTDYVPAEIEKLDAAVVYRNGSYAVLSVSDEPDKAKSIIESYFK